MSTYAKAQRAAKERERKLQAEQELEQALAEMTAFTPSTEHRVAEDAADAAASVAARKRAALKTYTTRAEETPRDIAEAMPFVRAGELVRQNTHHYPGLEESSQLFAGTVLEIPEAAHTRWRDSTADAVGEYVAEYDVRIERLREKPMPELDNVAKMSLRNRRADLVEWRLKKLRQWDQSAAFRATRMYDHFGDERVVSRADYAQQLSAKLERRVEEWGARLQKMAFMKKGEHQIEAMRKLAKLAFEGGHYEEEESSSTEEEEAAPAGAAAGGGAPAQQTK
jgi:hypothetical protein